MQTYKGDESELKVIAAGEPAFDSTSAALSDFYANGYKSAPFLLMLYDEGRMPFADRVERESFVDFIQATLDIFPFAGTFEFYITILKAIFGEASIIRFEVPAAGKLSIQIDASDEILFDFIGAELVDGVLTTFELTDQVGDGLLFRSISGIENEYALNLLFAEIIPAGIFPDTTLGFYTISDWISQHLDLMVTQGGDQIIFLEA